MTHLQRDINLVIEDHNIEVARKAIGGLKRVISNLRGQDKLTEDQSNVLIDLSIAKSRLEKNFEELKSETK